MTSCAGGESPNGSPIWAQYQTLKEQHPDTVLFFRLGDFYEVFDDDARLVARELQITLTSRPVSAGVRAAMAGVPVHSVDSVVARLLARGHQVALAEQLDAVAEPSVGRPQPPPPAWPAPEPPPAAPMSSPTQLSLPL